MVLHPIFLVLVRRPELVIDHLAGYADLAREEAAHAGAALARRALAWAVAVAAFLAFLVLAGTAAMLGAVLGEFHWMLLAVPAAALALSGAALLQTRRGPPHPALTELRAQWRADVEALRTLGAA